MNEKLTHANGAPVVDNLNIQTAGPRGPALFQDIWLLEKLAHFDREVIPERRMHAKGSGAYGTFTVTGDISRFTKAKLFSEIGKQTPAFVRFSTVAGERCAADAERDIRGFAVKLYTEFYYLALGAGVAADLILEPSKNETWRSHRFETLRWGLAIALMWSSLEKSAYPD